MFATPVVYPTRHLSGAPASLSSSIRSHRSSTATGPSSCGASLPDAHPVTAAAVFSFCLFAVGWVVFHRAEYAFAETCRGSLASPSSACGSDSAGRSATRTAGSHPVALSAGGARSAELKRDEFWALKDVTLETRRGEALGIIGPNGAGKSTILKLLTKILRPTEGRCALRGRVGALIEVAAGFHQDLTGRENVELQGVIMGMKRAEIARKFDQIVEFSGIPEFIDTPVRRYSSGMNARLGFAIAAHLEPEVLIVDEVLAVGDFAFQQRAFRRIREMVNQDVTTILVSHQLERIASLCTHAVSCARARWRTSARPPRQSPPM